MNFHFLGLSRSITSRLFSADPFTQNLISIAEMVMSDPENTVYHYGAEGSELNCTEHIDVLTHKEMEESFGKEYKKQEFLYALGRPSYANEMFNVRAIHEIKKRANRGDIICCFAGNMHLPICNGVQASGLIPVEPAMGYAAVFTHNRVFSSSAWMHFCYGEFHSRWDKLPEADKRDPKRWTAICNPYGMPKWQDDVIPHPVDMRQFDFKSEKGDYLLHISRIVPNKGIEMAIKIAEHLDMKLKIAGQGEFRTMMGFDPPKNVELVGVVGPEERSELMANAIAGFALTQYPEPFGLVPVEYGACGTPVITTDWGAYRETIHHGVSGYRIRTFQDGINAVKQIIDGQIRSEDCRKWVEDNFSIPSLTQRYNDYFKRIVDYNTSLQAGNGIYYLND